MTNDEIAVSLTEVLAIAGIGLTAAAANKVLNRAGVLERAWRESSKPGRPPKSFWKSTETGRALGVIEETNSLSPEPVVKYLPSRFPALWATVSDTMAMLLKEGEIKLRGTAPEQF